MPRQVRPSDFCLYAMLSEPSLSPDGKRVAFSVRRADIGNDEYRSDVCVADTKTAQVTIFTSGESDSDPLWSPDGKSILFTSRRGFAREEKGSSLWVIPARGGGARELVRCKGGVERAEWSPDSRAVFYLSDVIEDEKDDVKVIRRFGYWFNGRGFTYNRRRHLFKLEVGATKPVQVTRGEFNVSDFALSHGGRSVAYVASTDDLRPFISDLFVRDLRKGRTVKVTRSNMEITAIAWSPDDRMVAILGDDLPAGFASHEVVWVARPADRSVRRVDAVDRNKANGLNSDARAKAHGTHKLQWEREGIYYVQADGGSVGLHRLRPGSRPVAVVGGSRSVEGYDARGGRVSFVAMDSSHLEELYIVDGRERRLTSLNVGVGSKLGFHRPEPFSFRASDGRRVDGWVIVPGTRGRVPGILYVHGGPKTAFGHAFMHEFQCFAGAGYAVIYINPRGSDGYSEEFADIRGRYGTRDFDDLLEGLDWALKKHPRVDRRRLAIAGGSYGGYMVNWVVGHDDRFRAAVADRSISNWLSMWTTSDIGPHFTTDQMGADPWSGEEKLLSDSPIRYAPRVKTPLLLINSTEDYRCWMAEGLQFFTALKLLGKEAEIVLFPGENHDLSRTGRPRHRVARLEHYLRWFRKYLRTSG